MWLISTLPWRGQILEYRPFCSVAHGGAGLAAVVGDAGADLDDRRLAAQLHRPFLMPAPRFALGLALGRDATESLLTSDAVVRPEALLGSGFEFEHPTPADAIRASLG